MSKIVFFLEELSARRMLEGLLPRLLNEDIQWQLIHFNGKSDLEKQLPLKLRGWREPDTFFIIMRDKDNEDCMEIKKRLTTLCATSGRTNCLTRIACHTLENWYIGDLNAVENGLVIKGLIQQQNKKKYRDPDMVSNSYDELLKLTKYKYQKVSGSRAIGPYLSLTDNRSNSFRVFLNGIDRAVVSLQRENT